MNRRADATAKGGQRFELFFRRVGAYLIDMALLFVLLAPLGFAVQLLLDFTPTGREIWFVLLVNISLPSWIYFIAFESSESGSTVGKRLLGICVRRPLPAGARRPRIFLRTAVKLLPWELVHVASFGLAPADGEFTRLQTVVLSFAWLLILFYLAWAFATRGRSSPHDRIAGTRIERVGSGAD